MEVKQNFIFVSLIIFFIFLIIIEGKSSIKIISRVILTIVVLYFIYVKGVLENKSLIFLTVLVVFLISFINIFIEESIHKKAFVQLSSTVIITMLIGILILVICKVTHTQVVYQDGNLVTNSIKGMEFSIAVVAMLGIFLDIISRITHGLDCEKDKTEDIKLFKQFKIGVGIGKEVISEKINMLFLIFAGITLLPICMYVSNGYNMVQILNIDYIFFAGLVAFIGNIGLVLTVPITSIMYALINRNKTIYKTVSENKIDGKRSLKL